MARLRPVVGGSLESATLFVTFLCAEKPLSQRCLRLHATGGEWLGWIETPARTTHMQLRVPDASLAAQVEEIALHNVAERGPKCHPLANVPRWSTYQPPFPIRRIVLPADLSELAPRIEGLGVDVVARPISFAKLWRRVRGAACVLAPAWVRDLGLTLGHLERLAATAWLIVDLETLAGVLARAGVARMEAVSREASNDIVSARVVYADVPTRGLALQDVVPYATRTPAGGFRVRALQPSRSWRRYADEAGMAPLLTAETPWEEWQGHVLSAARPVGRGELIATDLPWLVAGRHGPLLAPRIAEHLLRMHVGLPLADHLQYWNRWHDTQVVVRDIADLAARYKPVRTVRWTPPQARVARLGLAIGPVGGDLMRHLVIDTGRIDTVAPHDGLPPEPMMIFIKWLAWQAREQTDWARCLLTGQVVTWQFETADGVKYAVNYAQAPAAGPPPQVLRVRLAADGRPRQADARRDSREDGCEKGLSHQRHPDERIAYEQFSRQRLVTLAEDEGVEGDVSLVFQERLTSLLRDFIEGAASREEILSKLGVSEDSSTGSGQPAPAGLGPAEALPAVAGVGWTQ